MAILYLTEDELKRMQQVTEVHDSVNLIDKHYAIYVSKDDVSIIEGIAHVLLHKYEVHTLKNILREQYYFANDAEMDAIVKYAQYLLSHGDIHEEMDLTDVQHIRRQELCTLIARYIEQIEDDVAFNIEGFFRFRLQEVWRSYPKVVENAIDEYMMEKEYREYITYLRDVVHDRPRKLPVLHIIYKSENAYQLIDENGCEIPQDPYIRNDDSDALIVYDDQVISHVMMVNPDLVVLHYIEPDHHIAISLQNIFEDRFLYCHGCKYCQEELEFRI